MNNEINSRIHWGFWVIGVVVAMVHMLRVDGLMAKLSPIDIVLMVVMPLIVAVFLVWYSRFAIRRHWVAG